MLLLTELLLAANEQNLYPVFGRHPLQVLPDGIAQWLRPFGVVENADLVLAKVVRHTFGVAPLRQCPLHDDPVIAGENASNLALVPLGQEFNAQGIISDILFGSGYAGLGVRGTGSYAGGGIAFCNNVPTCERGFKIAFGANNMDFSFVTVPGSGF
jgi:hypothetical protein